MALSLAFINSLCLLAQTNCSCNKIQALKVEINKVRQAKNIITTERYLEQIKSEKNTSCYLFGVNKITKFFIDIGEYEKGLNLVNDTRKLYSQPCQDTLLAENYLLTSSLYIKTQKSDSALYYSIKAEEFSSTRDLKLTQIMATGNIAIVFTDLNQPTKALWYFKKANAIALSIKDYNLVSTISGNIASVYAMLYDEIKNTNYLDSALVTQNESNKNARIANNNMSLQFGLGTMAGIYITKQNYSEALKYCDSVYSVKGLIDQARVVYFTQKANIYSKTNKTTLALAYADSAYKLTKHVSPIMEQIAIMNTVMSIYKSSLKTDKALAVMEEVTRISDSINNLDAKERLFNVEQKYNKSQNEKQIFELSKQKEIDELQIRSLIAFTGTAVLIIIIIVFFYRQSITKNKLKTIEIEQRLNRARMDPHFFFNILSSLRAYALKENNSVKTADYLTKYSKVIRQSLESSYNELITIETELDFLHNYFEIQKLRYPGRFDYTIKFSNESEISELLIPSMIIQPFVENAIEHGFSESKHLGTIALSFETLSNELKISIVDNGVGLMGNNQEQKAYPSRATQIVNDRLFLLNKQHKSHARFEINRNEGDGLSVNIYLPLIYSN